MSVCPVCKKESSDYDCPVCHKYFCEDHVLPESHRRFCKGKKIKIDVSGIVPKITAIVFIFALVFLALFLGKSILESIKNKGNSLISENNVSNKTVIEIVPIKIRYNFSEADFNKGQEIYGLITRQKIQVGYFTYLNDDYGNKISLMLNNEQKAIADSGKPEDVFQITGTLKKVREELTLGVESIKISERPKETIERVVVE